MNGYRATFINVKTGRLLAATFATAMMFRQLQRRTFAEGFVLIDLKHERLPTLDDVTMGGRFGTD